LTYEAAFKTASDNVDQKKRAARTKAQDWDDLRDKPPTPVVKPDSDEDDDQTDD